MIEEPISPRNRRQEIRRTTKSWTKVTCRKGTLDLGGNIATRVLDVGETGVRLIVGQQIAVKQEVAITLDTPNNLRPMRVVGQVMWCLETAEHQFCIGVQFGKRISYQDVMKLT